MHRHSTNAVIQFIQMENVLKFLLNGQSLGDIYLCVPPTKMLGGTCPPVPPIIAAPGQYSDCGAVYDV